MTKKNIVEQLQEKLDQNMREYRSELLCLTPAQLIDRAEEIAAAKVVCETFRDFGGRYPQEELEYLLQAENSLEVMRDQWLSEQEVDIHQEMGHALWALANEPNEEIPGYPSEPDYELDCDSECYGCERTCADRIELSL